MAFKIIASQCTACGSCEFDCPNQAVGMKGDVFAINAGKCGECEGFFDAPQCVEVCPAECIVPA